MAETKLKLTGKIVTMNGVTTVGVESCRVKVNKQMNLLRLPDHDRAYFLNDLQYEALCRGKHLVYSLESPEPLRIGDIVDLSGTGKWLDVTGEIVPVPPLFCPFCEAMNKKSVPIVPGEACPECGHVCTCLQEPACDPDECDYYMDPYNMDGDCIMTK